MRLGVAGLLAVVAASLAAAAPAGLPPVSAEGYPTMIASLAGRVVVVSMWATWCEPCREEFPDLVKVHRDLSARGLTVVAVSLDMASAVESAVLPFLAGQGADFPCYVKAPGDDDTFINTVDRRWSGALPATFVYDAEGRLARSIYGPTRYDEIVGAVTPLLPRN